MSLVATDSRIGYIDERGSIYIYQKIGENKAKSVKYKTDGINGILAMGGNHMVMWIHLGILFRRFFE